MAKAESAKTGKVDVDDKGRKKKGGHKVLMTILAAIVVLIVAAGAYYEMTHANFSLTMSVTTQSTTIGAGANASSIPPAAHTVMLASNATLGSYLENGTGWTLYVYANDTRYSGSSACYGSCATYWPPFYAANISVPSGLNASAFGTIVRTGGDKQTTYRGSPLYFYIGDKAAGQARGQGVGGTWYVAISTPPTTTVTTTTSTSTTTSSSTTTTSTSTTTISQSAMIACQAHDFLRVNESISCSPVKLTLVDVGQGESQYEISNAIVDVYLNGNLAFMNMSLLQNQTPYWLNFSNGHNLEIYAYQVTYAIYPVYRSANLSIAYR